MNRLGYKYGARQTVRYFHPSVIFTGKAGAFSSGASGKLLETGESACSSNNAGKAVAYSRGAQGTSLT